MNAYMNSPQIGQLAELAKGQGTRPITGDMIALLTGIAARERIHAMLER
jgi:hypothetical protein